MKIKQILTPACRGVAFEFFPPKTDEGEESLFQRISELDPSHPRYVSVTYGAGGSSRDRTQRLVKRIARECRLTVMAHLAVVGQKSSEIAAILEDYREAGIQNIMALRGDTPRGTSIRPQDGDFPYAESLVRFIRQQQGDHFSIGVAAFPEMHPDSPDLEHDIHYLKQKLDAGADFAVTQMFFDNSYFYRLADQAARAGISQPVIPGIMPISNYGQIRTFSELSGAHMPAGLIEKMEQNQQDEEVMYRIGLEHVLEQCRDLMDKGFSFLHFFTLNKSQASMDIIHQLGLD